jgi:hypothetical protein
MMEIVLALLVSLQGAAPARPGVVTGQILIRAGSPAAAVRVSAIPAPPPDARPEDGTQYYEARPPVSTVLTNSQGRYRLANIPPGRYHIVASMLGQATYYPATTDINRATVVTVAPDSTAESVDFTLLLPLGGRVKGRVTPAPGADMQQTAVLSGLKLQELLEMPVGRDGTFEFGYVPRGTYLLSLFPTPPGMASRVFQVGDEDVASLEFVLPPVRTVTGRIVVQNGPLPTARLAFSTGQSYVSASINPDLTFSTRLHAGSHRAELGGMPVGYSLLSVRVGSAGQSQGIVVGNTDVSGVVITVSAPRRLPSIHGQIMGVAAARLASARVQLTGPIIGSLEAPVRNDGSFEFAAVTPGRYSLRLPQVPEVTPIDVVAVGNDADVRVALSAR